MVAHDSGVIGLPLRLLAREVYARVCEKVGASQGRADHRRGEDRAAGRPLFRLHRRGDAARDRRRLRRHRRGPARRRSRARPRLHRPHPASARPRRRRCCSARPPCAAFSSGCCRASRSSTRPRLSQLAYAGQKKMTRLPRRSAIVAFSADEVYAIAELIRRQRGGAAVVLGALSPAHPQRAGRALPVRRRRLSGRHRCHRHGAQPRCRPRRLRPGPQIRRLPVPRPRPPAELGQIAGRAGRHLRDGTFGVTGQVDPFDDELVEKIEAPRLRPGARCCNGAPREFDFASLDALKQLDRDAGAGRGPDARAAGRRRSRRWNICRAIRTSAIWRPAASASRCSGKSARCPTTAASRRPSMPSSSPRSIDDLARHGPCRRGLHGRAGAPRRLHRGRHRHAVAPHRRRSAPGPTSRTVPAGLPIRHTGRKRRAKSRTDCPMRCMSG